MVSIAPSMPDHPVSLSGHILVVDDNPDQLRLLVRSLEQAGHRVRPADSGELALAAINHESPELILLDLRLTGLSGLSVCGQLKASTTARGIPVLLISGASDRQERLAGFRLGAVDFIQKPYDTEELLARVQIHLQLSRLRNQLLQESAALQETTSRLEFEISERRRAQSELEQKASRLALATQTGGIGIWDWDLTTGHLLWDSTLYQLYGLPETPAVSSLDAWSSRLHPDDQGRNRDEIERAVAGTFDYDTEFRVVLPNGEIRHLRARASVQRDAGGAPLRMLGINWDMTERKRNQERLLLFSRAVEQSPASVVITNTRGEIEYVNKKFTQLTGYTADEVIGHNPRLLKTGETTAEEYREMWRTLRAGRMWSGEFHNRTKSGLTYIESCSITPIRGEKGVVTHYLASKEDITAQRAAEAALRHERWLLNCLMDTVPVFIFFKDAAGRFIRVNQAVARLFNTASPAAVLGRTDYDFFAEHDARVTEADEESILQSGRPMIDKREKITDRLGQTRWFSTSKMPLRDPEGTIIGTFGLASDITTQKLGEEERLKLQVQLNQAQKLESIGRLAAGIAHEINTPSQFVSDNISYVRKAMGDIERLLEAHTGMLAWLERSGALDPELEAIIAPTRKIKGARLRQELPAALTDAADGMARITKIVRAMKSFSHPSGEQTAATDLNQSIESTLIVCRNEWKYVADLETHYAPDLPLVPCLRGDFNQVVLNLVVNAAHAISDVIAQSPGTKGRITVSTRVVEPFAEVRISDTGTGIPESVRPHLFEPFFTTKGVGKGTGQGLALARSVIVDRHKGTLTFETEVGRGTTFIIRLPLPHG